MERSTELTGFLQDDLGVEAQVVANQFGYNAEEQSGVLTRLTQGGDSHVSGC